MSGWLQTVSVWAQLGVGVFSLLFAHGLLRRFFCVFNCLILPTRFQHRQLVLGSMCPFSAQLGVFHLLFVRGLLRRFFCVQLFIWRMILLPIRFQHRKLVLGDTYPCSVVHLKSSGNIFLLQTLYYPYISIIDPFLPMDFQLHLVLHLSRITWHWQWFYVLYICCCQSTCLCGIVLFILSQLGIYKPLVLCDMWQEVELLRAIQADTNPTPQQLL